MAAAVNGNWAYAVPLDETNGFAPPQRTSTLQSQSSGTGAGTVTVTGTSTGTGTGTGTSNHVKKRSASQRRPSDFNVQSDSEAVGSRKASLRASNGSASRKRSRNTLRERKSAGGINVDDSAWIHRDKLAQIEIQEMEEAGIPVRQSRRSSSTGPADASAPPSRPASAVRRPMSKDTQKEGSGDAEAGAAVEYATFDDYHRKRVSTIPAADEEEQELEQNYNAAMTTELRTPEEVAAEQQAYKQHMMRPGTSRIPISKVSPVPVPQQVVDRDAPLPRSRAGSGAWSGAWDELQYARRARSGSVGSQILLDDNNGEGTRISSRPTSFHLRNSNENSPPKSRLPHKPTPGGPKSPTSTSISSPNGTGTRPTSSEFAKLANGNPTTTKQRPTSRSGPGHKSRPSTSHAQHAPEGEAPWIAGMYKPDPRLPPDQQILPTHAKRLQQQQWEKDGKSGTAYDRELNLLNEGGFVERRGQFQGGEGGEQQEFEQGNGGGGGGGVLSPLKPGLDRASPAGSGAERPWPLSPGRSDTRSEMGSLRPGTSGGGAGGGAGGGGGGGGGYKITPTIAPSPVSLAPPTPVSEAAGAHNATPRLPTDWDGKEVVLGSGDVEKQGGEGGSGMGKGKKKKEAGCGCCVVM